MRDLGMLENGIAFLDTRCLFNAAVEFLDEPALLAFMGELLIVGELEIVRSKVAHVSVFEDDPRNQHKSKSLQPDFADLFLCPIQSADAQVLSLRFIDEPVLFDPHDELPFSLDDRFHIFQ